MSLLFNTNRLAIKLTVALALSFAALALSGCGGGGGGGGGEPAGSGTVIGRVITVDTSTPISGATVTCSGRTATTGQDGRFTFLNIPAGTRTVTASNGASTQSVTVLVLADLTADTGDILLADAPPPPPGG